MTIEREPPDPWGDIDRDYETDQRPGPEGIEAIRARHDAARRQGVGDYQWCEIDRQDWPCDAYRAAAAHATLVSQLAATREANASLLGLADIARLLIHGWDSGFPVDDCGERQFEGDLIERMRPFVEDAALATPDAGPDAVPPPMTYEDALDVAEPWRSAAMPAAVQERKP